jgi:hypothetical protein
MRSVSSIVRVTCRRSYHTDPGLRYCRYGQGTAASLHRRCRLPSTLRPDPPTHRWPLRRFPRQAPAASASLLSASPAILRDVSHFEAARTVPKSADRHDAAAQYGHYRHRRVRAYDCRGRGSHRGSAPARAQDDRVGVSRQDPDACVVDVQTLCLRGCVAPSSRLADLFGRRQNVVDHYGAG